MTPDLALPTGALPAPGPGSDPAIIYHYTDAAGLLGITCSRTLWASDVWFMNDRAEATYGRDAIKRYLRSKAPAAKKEKNFCDTAIAMMTGPQQENGGGSYVACLSAKGDDLSQWRAYGRSGGVSIGFERQGLERLGQALPSPWTFTVRKVAYGKALQYSLLDHYYIPIVSGLHVQRATSLLIQTEAIKFLVDALNLAPGLKNPAFSDEAEFRVHIFLGSDADIAKTLHFRNSEMGVTPYLKVPLCEPGKDELTIIREVIIGPQRHPRESRRAIRQLLDANKLTDVEIRVSEIPLRA